MQKIAYGFTAKEYSQLRKLKTPARIQDFVDKIPYNQEKNRETCYSPKYVLKLNTANCIEGAVFAAAALRVNGFKPLILDLESDPKLDDDHVIAVFQVKGYWGAIGKSKFTGLTYRNAVYKTVRELVMSYFDDYYNEQGKMSLRKYSIPVNLSRFDKKKWMVSEKDLWFIPDYLCRVKHIKLGIKNKLRDVNPKKLKAGMLYYPKGYKRH